LTKDIESYITYAYEVKMNVLIHDRKDTYIKDLLKDSEKETIFITDNGKIKPCISCFSCWVKTPGQCVINDGYNNMGVIFSKANQLIIISQCFYGGYSPFVKNVLDRSACPYLLPFIIIENGETRHPKRYKNNLEITTHFYGLMSENEKETARKLVKANGINLSAKVNVFFYESFEKLQGI
jgi:multimeric flavodoxin WrbA